MADNLNPTIFLSYSWANKDIADEIDDTFKTIGIQFKRDVRDLEYRKSIKEFMHQIGQSDYVVMIISSEYLMSLNCMYEVAELLNTHELEKRILPVVLDSAKIFNITDRKGYYDFWKEQEKTAGKIRKTHPNQDAIEHELKCQRICGNLPEFFQKITDLNASTYQNLRKNNYKELLNSVGFSEKDSLHEVLEISTIKDKEEQELELEAFLNKNPNNKYGLFQKAYLFNEAKQFKKAKKYYEDILAIYINYQAAHNNLALILEGKFSDYEGAKEHYEMALKIDPNYIGARNNLALFLAEKLSNYDEARTNCEIALKIAPNDSQSHFNLALILEDGFSDYERAKIHYEIALKIDPTYSNACFNLALLLKRHFSDYNAAKICYETALRINPFDSDAHNNLGVLLVEHLNEYNQAKSHFEQAMVADSHNEQAQQNLKKLFELYPEHLTPPTSPSNSQ